MACALGGGGSNNMRPLSWGAQMEKIHKKLLFVQFYFEIGHKRHFLQVVLCYMCEVCFVADARRVTVERGVMTTDGGLKCQGTVT